MTLRKLTIADVLLGLQDLRTNRLEPLRSFEVGKAYEPSLMGILAELEALPDAKKLDLPFTTELANADELHDGLGAAIWNYTDAVRRHPRLSSDHKAAAQRVRDAFIPRLGELRGTFQDEAARARARRKLVAERQADLQLFATPGDPPQTLLDWVNDFLDQGEALDGLLSQRATEAGAAAGTEGDRSAAMGLRSRAIGLITRCRGALADELRTNAALPKNLDKLVFGYIDDLARARG
jgi:hypothetical protein